MVVARVLIGLVALSLAAVGVSGCVPAPRSYALTLEPTDRPPSMSASEAAPPAALTTARGKKATPLPAPVPRRHYAIVRTPSEPSLAERKRRADAARKAAADRIRKMYEEFGIDIPD